MRERCTAKPGFAALHLGVFALNFLLDRTLHLCYIHFMMRFDPYAPVEWAVLPRGDVAPHWSSLYVTMSRKGSITISRVTHERLGSPHAYLIKLDAVNQRLALEPTELHKPNAYPARKQGRRGSKVLRAYRLLTQWAIRPPDTIEFNQMRIDPDGQLIIELGSAVISPKAWSQCRKKSK